MSTTWDPIIIDQTHLELLLAGGRVEKRFPTAEDAQGEEDRLRQGLGDQAGVTIAIQRTPPPSLQEHVVVLQAVFPLLGAFAGYWEQLTEIALQAAAVRGAAPWRPGHFRARLASACWSGIIVVPQPLGDHAAAVARWMEAHLSAETYELTVPYLDERDIAVRFVTPDGEPHREAYQLFARRFRPTATWCELFSCEPERAQVKRAPVVRQQTGGYILRRPGTDPAALQVRLADLLRHDLCRPTLDDVAAGRIEPTWEAVDTMATRLDDVVVDCLHALLDAGGGTTTDVFLPWGTYPDEDHLVDQINRLLRGSPYVVELREVTTKPVSFRLRLARPDEVPYQGALDPGEPLFPLLPHHTLDFVHVR